MAAVMAQPTPMDLNGAPTPDTGDFNQVVAPGKRKRDSEDEGATTTTTSSIDQQDRPDSVRNSTPPPTNGVVRDQAELVKTCFEVLTRYVVFFLPASSQRDRRRGLPMSPFVASFRRIHPLSRQRFSSPG